MLFGLIAGTLLLAALLLDLERARVRAVAARQLTALRARWTQAQRARLDRAGLVQYDPGRELRAEQRARALLRSCVNDEQWAMYRDLGFLRAWGGGAHGAAGARYAYLIYPHRPLVVYVPATGALLNEYCVAFPDLTRPYGSARLPDADDVLAKWMALCADERGLVAEANMHLPGRQLDPEQVREDLARLARWEREHAGRRFARQLGDARAA